jgi:restriction endonuclease S subunit
MNHKKLADIADIQSGLVLSRKEAKPYSEEVFNYQCLNLRSVNNDDIVNTKTLSKFCSCEEIDNQFITKENEIIMRLFAPFQPVLITDILTGYLVPSQFAIIRITSKEILPGYLRYHLSQRSVLNVLAQMDSGHGTRGIKISTLSDVLIPTVDIKRQRTVIAIAELQRKINALHLELLEQYGIQADAAIKRAIGGEIQ